MGGYILAADAGLTDAAGDVTAILTDNLPVVLGVVAAFVGASVLIGFVRGLRKNRV